MKEIQEADKRWLCILFGIPYEAYHDERKALNPKTNAEITNENIVVQSNFDMKA